MQAVNPRERTLSAVRHASPHPCPPGRSLLVATDLSPPAEWAARRAALIAARQGHALELLHVQDSSITSGSAEPAASGPPWMPYGPGNGAARELAALAAALRSTFDVPARTRLRHGSAVQEIARAAQGTALLVLGAAGQHPLRDLFIGSTADRLLRKAAGPMLVVRKSPHGPYRRVLLPVDLDHQERADVEALLAATLAFAPDAQCRLFHAAAFPFEGKMTLAGIAPEQVRDYREAILARARSQLCELVEAVPGGARRCVPQVVAGPPARLVCTQASAMQADLIVMARQHSSMLEDWLLGSVTRHVLLHAPCDILVIPGPARMGALALSH